MSSSQKEDAAASIDLLENPQRFFRELHVQYIRQLAIDLAKPTSYEGAVTEHLKMSGIYWSLTALNILLVEPSAVDKLMGVTTISSKQAAAAAGDEHDENANTTSNEISILDWLWTCYDNGGFGGNTGHPAHLLYTLSALQILAVSDARLLLLQDDNNNDDDRLRQHKDEIVKYIASLQQPDGSFVGDDSGEIDTRFTYCALQSLALLLSLDAVNVEAAADYILSCRNRVDGGFGSCMGAESHAGQVFCCIGALAIAGKLSELNDADVDLLGWWLSERQVDSGGLNGRPEKQADVCYSWWILSALSILGKMSWINGDKLAAFILKCQDEVDGGIADRPDDMADVFHTFFGIAGLSLLGHLHHQQGPSGIPAAGNLLFRQIDPVYALPTDVVRRLKLPGQVMARREEGVEERLQHYDVVYMDN